MKIKFSQLTGLLLTLSLVFCGCTKDNGTVDPAASGNKGAKISFTAGISDGASSSSNGTKVAYDDASLNLTWEANDKLAALGYAAGTYKGVSKNFTYGGTPGATSGTFAGTAVTDATTYKIYYPSTVNVTAAGVVSLSMLGQVQNGSGSTAHLKDYMLLESPDGDDIQPSGTFKFSLKSSIMKFVISNVPAAVGTLKSLTVIIENASDTKSQTISFTSVVFNESTSTLTAYMSFLPGELPGPKSGGKFKVVLLGDKTYIFEKTSTGGKTYEAGKRYTATIDMTSATLGDYMSYTIKTTAANTSVPLGLSPDGQTAPAKLDIDWGDGSSSTIESGTSIGASSNNTHNYVTAGTYTVTIISYQGDATLQQISKIKFYNSAYFVSVDTPLLNSTQTSFEDCFSLCSSLKTVSVGLFDKNTIATDFRDCFSDCKILVMNKYIFSSTDATATRFSGKTMNFSTCFYKAGYSLTAGTQGQAPELWKYKMSTSSVRNNCFSNAYFTNNTEADGYTNQVISAWGAPK